MLIIDAHLDLSMNALQWNRDLLLSVYTIRTQEQRTPGKGRAQGTVALPDMRQGRLAVSIATLIARSTGRPAPHIDFHSPTQAYGMAHGQLAYYRALEEAGHIRILTDLSALNDHVAEWSTWDAAHPDPIALDEASSTPPLGFVISMEGADPIQQPEQLAAWYAAGLRLIGPTHYGAGALCRWHGNRVRVDDVGRAAVARNGATRHSA